ncbi:unnamed protein product [Brassicogethes aeneus]|uniref:RNA helicase n=1 Tax=Brassicogethes aeneus TaxID=1431903 RepID=A0A9P0AWE1_BRAAE|nr:unnamed protein product [Brassicogethes aeneus]
MSRKGYNWRARKVVETIIDDSTTKNIDLDIAVKGSYDASNELVLPSKKRKTKIKKDNIKVTRILSKKQRKKYEKILEKKKKQEGRVALLEALQEVRAGPEELQQLTSLVSVQTKGLKRLFQERANPGKFNKPKKDQALVTGEVKLNSLSGTKRRKLTTVDLNEPQINDPNVVGFEESEESDEDSEDDCEEIKENIIKNEEIVEDDEEVVEEETEQKDDVVAQEVVKEVIEIKDDEVKQVENSVHETKIDRKPAVFVDVIRNEEIQAARLKLPILAEEQQIMEIINDNSVIILAGETGSGKTTQVPQFLYEAGYALKKQIAVTEPRRVAAISMSKRVAEEMNLSTKEISYLIRFEGNATDETKIKFMTDGVLLKELQSDFLLRKYSVVILDEAHERSVYTDILIGLLSRIVPLREKRGDPMKLIIMSATLRLEDFTSNKRLFKITPPVIKVDARQFPVTIHFNKRTSEDYLKEAFNKAVKINTTLPEGGILIFVTGQREVKSLVRKLRKAFPLKHKSKILEKEKEVKDREAKGEDDVADSDVEEGMRHALRNKKKKKLKVIPRINLDDYSLPGDTETASDVEDDLDSDREDSDVEVSMVTNAQPLWTLPLYSLLPSHKQQKVFQPPPAGCRMCIVSTNVAETSLTIPNVKYVVDTGKTKVKLYDKVTGVTSYVVHWTSKASSDQRAGRAGRTGPGHCYRLYSSAVFNDTFREFSPPEIQQKPVDDLYLQMKCMNIDKVVNFPFPTAPDLLQLKTAESRLETLGALTAGTVTALGKAISKFPVLPRYGKMLALSHQQDLLPYTVCMVAALSVQEVLLEVPILNTGPEELKAVRQKWAATRRQWAGLCNSLLLGDNMVLLRAVGAAEYANSQGKLEKFCDENGLRMKAIIEIRKLRMQLTNEIKKNLPEAEVTVDPKMPPPNDLQAKLLRQILLSGMGDQIAKKIAPEEVKEGEDRVKFKYAYHANNMEEPVFLHQGSVLRKTLPEYVVYQEIYETNKMYMRGVTAIEPEWLATYVPSLCNLGEPLDEPPPRFDEPSGKLFCTVTGTFGSQGWSLPSIEVPFPHTIEGFKWFARFVLEGKVCKKLAKYGGVLLSQPSIMVKSWAKLQPRTDAVLKALIGKDAMTRQGLLEVFRDEPTFLLQEYLKWVPESAHGEITLLWPPIG